VRRRVLLLPVRGHPPRRAGHLQGSQEARPKSRAKETTSFAEEKQ